MKAKAQKLVDLQIVSKCKTEIPKDGYYVYAIVKENIVVYIGKGKNNRVKSHFGKSSNMKLAFDYKENPTLFDYYILATFDEECETLDFEEVLIRECKTLKIELYNTIHYDKDFSYNQELRSYMMLLNQFELMVFYKKYNVNIDGVFTPLERANLVLDMIKDTFKNCIKVPLYKGKNITDLTAIEKDCGDYIRIKIS